MSNKGKRNKSKNIQKQSNNQHPPTTQDSASTRTQVQKVEQFSGPIPPPSLLEQYNSIVPDAAQRIIAMAEREALHRQKLETHALTSDTREARLGQILGLTIGLSTLIAAAVVAIYAAGVAAAVVGSVLGVSGITGLVAVFVYGRKHNNQK